MRVAVAGATGLIGSAVCDALAARHIWVTGLTRDPGRARRFGHSGVEWERWEEPTSEPAPSMALAGCNGVINLLGERIDQRWSGDVKRRIHDSRVLGTRNLLAGIEAADPRPAVLISQSAVGYYGDRGDTVLDESAEPGSDFLAEVCVAWEAEARRAEALGLRVVITRSGPVLAAGGGLLRRMLRPFKLGLGGPVAGGRQYVPWVHVKDVAEAMVWAFESEQVSGPLNLTAPDPATGRELAKTLGHVLGRPAAMPVPKLALRLRFGELAESIAGGQRALPKRTRELGYEFRFGELEPALRDVLGRG